MSNKQVRWSDVFNMSIIIAIVKRMKLKAVASLCAALLLAVAAAVPGEYVYASDAGCDGASDPKQQEAAVWTDYQNHWARRYINFVTEHGYMTALNGYFAPDEPMTRAMFVQALASMAGVISNDPVIWGTATQELYEPDLESLAEKFSDIDVNASYAAAATWAADEGIVNGTDDWTFKPDGIIDRQTMAVMMYRTTESLGIELNEDWSVMMDYGDLDQVSDWAIDGIAYCTMTSLMHGNDEGNFLPKRILTRAEAATVLVRLSEYINE